MPFAAWGVLVLSLAATAGHAQTPESRTRVLMLGTGNPSPDPQRSDPATAVVVDSQAFLVDAGAGVARQLAAARAQRLLDGVELPRHIFITHLHSDHTLGLPELIYQLWMRRPREEITLYGPRGLQAMVTHVLEAWSEDLRIRIRSSGEMAGEPAPHVNVHEIEPGEAYKDPPVTVTAFSVHHGTWPQAFGYRLETPDKVVVISGDAGPPSAIPDQCQRCDILVHEGGRPEAAATPYFREFHTTAEQLVAIANQSQPKLLVLTHQPAGGFVEGLAIIRAGYPGTVVIAEDLDVYPR
jgi:ribonuclease Z